MNAVIDEDLHRSFMNVLSPHFNVFDIRDHGLRGFSDDKIFKFAQEQEAVLFTSDLGFSNIIQFPLKSHYGIVILRFPNEMSTMNINENVEKLLGNLSKKDYKGNLIILSPGKLRLRRKGLED